MRAFGFVDLYTNTLSEISHLPTFFVEAFTTKEVVNNKLVEELQEENKKLNEELNKITDALTKASKAKFMKNSDLSSLYDE